MLWVTDTYTSKIPLPIGVCWGGDINMSKTYPTCKWEIFDSKYPCINCEWREPYDCSLTNLKCMWRVHPHPTNRFHVGFFAILFWSHKIVVFSWSEIQLNLIKHHKCKVLNNIVPKKAKQFHMHGCDPASMIICSKWTIWATSLPKIVSPLRDTK